MEKCSPIEMRKNLIAVEQFKKYGIDFVAVPVRDKNHKILLVNMGNEILEEMATKAEAS